MKKLAIIAIAAVSLSGCSWFKSSSQWADNAFFGGDSNPQSPSPNYPYYYSSAAAPIDANEKGAYSSPYPPAAPGAINSQYNSTAFTAQPNQYGAPLQATGGYGATTNAPSVSVTYGSKGTDVSGAKTGDYIKNPQPVLPASPDKDARVPANQSLPTLQGTQGQFTPQVYAPQAPQPYGYAQQPYAPQGYAPQPYPAAPVAPQPPQGYGYAPQPYATQPQPYPPAQNPYYGQQYAPQQYQGQYQYPPAK